MRKEREPVETGARRGVDRGDAAASGNPCTAPAGIRGVMSRDARVGDAYRAKPRNGNPFPRIGERFHIR
jgi:hypothetical protein